MRFFIFIVIFIFISSCRRESVVYSEKISITNGWAYEDTIHFAFFVRDTSHTYDLNLEVTHAKDYAWENCYVRIRTFFPDDSVKTDVLSLELSDGSAWMGSCKGEKCRATIPIQQRIRFPMPGQYALTFEQYMREEIIYGILKIGLSVVEAKGSRDQGIKG